MFWKRLRPFRRHRRPLGEEGERLAARYLRRRRYRIVARRFRAAGGELDLVAVHRRRLVFIEVKARRGTDYGDPIEAVDFRKRQRILSAARAFVARHHLLDVECRFDIITVMWPVPRGRPRVRHWPGAFDENDAEPETG